jgi:ABC-type branched-subunit amino acid transport system ATPase component
LSVLENLLVFGAEQPGEQPWQALLRTAAARNRESEIIGTANRTATRLNLAPLLHDKATALSGGQKKLLDLGRALMCAPQLILLDEPVAGVNPALGVEIAEAVKELARNGYHFIIVEHNMNFVRTISDNVIVLAEGQVLARGTFEQVVDDVQVQEAYFGRNISA